MLINIIYGDPSHDGHNKTQTLSLEINDGITLEDVQYAITSGEKKLGIKLSDIAYDYEDTFMPEEYFEIFRAQGITFTNEEENSWLEKNEIDTEDFEDILILLINVGDPGIEAKRVEIPDISLYHGYGLFWG